MKRFVILTVVLFVLSLGGLAMMTLFMCWAQDRVEFSYVAQRGDAAVAEGLHLTEQDLLSSRVLWTTEHDLSAETRDTESRFSGKSLPYISSGETWEYGIYVESPDTPRLREQARKAEGGEIVFYPAKEMDYYDLCVAQGFSGDVIRMSGLDVENKAIAPFPMLRIPVGEKDWMAMTVWDNAAGIDCSVYAMSMENRFRAWSAPVKNGAVMTVGFGPDVQTKADWAPAGFGLWLMALGESAAEEPQLRLVYPLDIETQRVVKMITGPDGEQIYLFLAEGEKLSLQVLDAETFTLAQTLDMGTIGQTEKEETYYGSFNGNLEGVSDRYTAYESVLVRQEEDFCAVAAGKHLTVLERRDSGLAKVFDCEMLDLYVTYIKDGLGFAWEDENVDPDRISTAHNPADERLYWTFEDMSMALKDGKLAIAWGETGMSGADVMVEVYSAEGLVYARGIQNGLYRQSLGSTQYIREWTGPQVVWN